MGKASWSTSSSSSCHTSRLFATTHANSGSHSSSSSQLANLPGWLLEFCYATICLPLTNQCAKNYIFAQSVVCRAELSEWAEKKWHVYANCHCSKIEFLQMKWYANFWSAFLHFPPCMFVGVSEFRAGNIMSKVSWKITQIEKTAEWVVVFVAEKLLYQNQPLCCMLTIYTNNKNQQMSVYLNQVANAVLKWLYSILSVCYTCVYVRRLTCVPPIALYMHMCANHLPPVCYFRHFSAQLLQKLHTYTLILFTVNYYILVFSVAFPKV